MKEGIILKQHNNDCARKSTSTKTKSENQNFVQILYNRCLKPRLKKIVKKGEDLKILVNWFFLLVLYTPVLILLETDENLLQWRCSKTSFSLLLHEALSSVWLELAGKHK